MVEEKDTAWRELLHKHGLIQVEYILEKYGSGCATDVSELKKDVFRQNYVYYERPYSLQQGPTPSPITISTDLQEQVRSWEL